MIIAQPQLPIHLNLVLYHWATHECFQQAILENESKFDDCLLKPEQPQWYYFSRPYSAHIVQEVHVSRSNAVSWALKKG
jgi:hypothetical protein